MRFILVLLFASTSYAMDYDAIGPSVTVEEFTSFGETYSPTSQPRAVTTVCRNGVCTTIASAPSPMETTTFVARSSSVVVDAPVRRDGPLRRLVRRFKERRKAFWSRFFR